MERRGEVDSKERRGRVQRWLADATFYNREEGPTKDLLAGEREREREENLCEDSHKFWQVVLLAMKNQNFSFQAPPSFFRVSRNEARRPKLVQRKTRQGSSRREKTRRSVSNSTIISCVGPEIASKIEGARRERGCEPILLFLFFTTRRVRASSNLASFYLLALGPAFLNANFGPADSVR